MTAAIAECEEQLLQLVRALKNAQEACEDTSGRSPPVTLEAARAVDGDRLRMEAYIADERVRLQRVADAVKDSFKTTHVALGSLTNLTEKELLAQISRMELDEANLDAQFLQLYAEGAQLADDIDARINEAALQAFR